jgi:hypothetical protein
MRATVLSVLVGLGFHLLPQAAVAQARDVVIQTRDVELPGGAIAAIRVGKLGQMDAVVINERMLTPLTVSMAIQGLNAAQKRRERQLGVVTHLVFLRDLKQKRTPRKADVAITRALMAAEKRSVKSLGRGRTLFASYRSGTLSMGTP